MSRIEKTVFISYRRKDLYHALAVYQNLTAMGYDVFFDFTSIHSGDFERIILSNIKARAHFLIILTPSALDRCNNPRDWLRREIETAIEEKRNVIPLFFDDFSFDTRSISRKMTGKLATIKKYNGLNIPLGFFDEAMNRLCEQYLNVESDAVLHPIVDEVQKVVKEQQVAADEAIAHRKEAKVVAKNPTRKLNILPFGIGALVIVGLVGLIFGSVYVFRNILVSPSNPSPAPLPTNIPPSNPTFGSTWIQSIDAMAMIYVPAGEFKMGSEYGNSDEWPVHTVNLDSYWIDQTEVTNVMYAKCVQAGNCDQPTDIKKFNDAKYKNHPVVYVSWIDASAYCKWAGRRLPTEAEWEKAASWDEEEQRKHVFPWGSSLDCSLANYWGKDGGCIGDTMVVGSFEGGKSSYNVYDMAGNVWEWVEDWYSETYFLISPSSNPSGPASGSERLLRGGGWFSTSSYLRSAGRYWYHPTTTKDNLGFRCAMDASE